MVSNGRDPVPIPATALAAASRPFGSSRMLPPQAYTSAAVYGWEQRHLLSGWQCVGRSADLAGPGDQRAERAGDSTVLLVRGQDGVLRGFANTCRHRGHELLPCGASASKRAVVCPYHAWSYRLDGSLALAPGYPQGPDFRMDDFPLAPVRVAQWHGWVFADPSGIAPELTDHLGVAGERVAPYAPERLVVAARHEYEIAANWKTISENYHECYHCPLIHPELCAVSPPDSGQNWASDRPGAFVGGWMDLRDGMETMSLDGRSGGLPIAGLAADLLRRVDYLQLFPNLLISLHPDYVMTHRIVPLAAGRTWVECAWAFPPEALERDGFDPSYAADFWDVTNRQDWAACESVQRGLESGRAQAGPLSPAEDAVYRFVQMVIRGYTGGPLHEKMPAAQVLG
jgi:glycine betaine catabolism A